MKNTKVLSSKKRFLLRNVIVVLQNLKTGISYSQKLLHVQKTGKLLLLKAVRLILGLALLNLSLSVQLKTLMDISYT